MNGEMKMRTMAFAIGMLVATPVLAQSPTEFRIGDVVPGMTDEKLDRLLYANAIRGVYGMAPDQYTVALSQLRLQGQIKAYEARLRAAGQQAPASAPTPAYTPAAPSYKVRQIPTTNRGTNRPTNRYVPTNRERLIAQFAGQCNEYDQPVCRCAAPKLAAGLTDDQLEFVMAYDWSKVDENNQFVQHARTVLQSCGATWN